jgi:hypothetical protein
MFDRLLPIAALLATAGCDLSPPPAANRPPTVVATQPPAPAVVEEPKSKPAPPVEFGAGQRLLGKWEWITPGDEDSSLSLMKITFEFAPEGQLEFRAEALGKAESHSGKWKCLKDQGDEIVLEVRGDPRSDAAIDISNLFSQGEAQHFKIIDQDHIEMSPLAGDGEAPLKFKRIAAAAEPPE